MGFSEVSVAGFEELRLQALVGIAAFEFGVSVAGFEELRLQVVIVLTQSLRFFVSVAGFEELRLQER